MSWDETTVPCPRCRRQKLVTWEVAEGVDRLYCTAKDCDLVLDLEQGSDEAELVR